MSRGAGSLVLSACSLLDYDALTTATRLLPGSDRHDDAMSSHSSRNCDQMMRDIEDKFIRLRVSFF